MTRPEVRTGADVFIHRLAREYAGARIGFVTSFASVDHELVSMVDRLHAHEDFKLTALFAPEHGVRGDRHPGQVVSDEIDPQSGVAVYSLFGERRAPTQEQLAGIDVLMVDLVDVGCRYWTFLSTMSLSLRAAAEANVPVVVLDRPNPITGTRIEGNLVADGFRTFVGFHPIPMRTGITLGEAAQLFNVEYGLGAGLVVVPCEGWRRDMWFDETGLPYVPPTPNTPTIDTLTLYPGTCLLEGTNVSEGRGTTRPFEVIGAPWIDAPRLCADLNERGLPGVRFRPTYFTPSIQKHAGTPCAGAQVHILDRNALCAVEVGIHVLHALLKCHPTEFEWLPGRSPGSLAVDRLAGGDDLRCELDAGREPAHFLGSWEHERATYEQLREKYLLY